MSAEGGTLCPACAHPPCRAGRSARQVPRGGHTAEFAAEHRAAAAIQAQFAGVTAWFGESTQSYWALTSAGLVEARDTDTLLLALWARTAAPRPTRRPERPRAAAAVATEPSPPSRPIRRLLRPKRPRVG